jgi:hypothetical protein
MVSARLLEMQRMGKTLSSNGMACKFALFLGEDGSGIEAFVSPKERDYWWIVSWLHSLTYDF